METYATLVEAEGPDEEKSREQLRRERDEWRHLFDQLIAKFPEPIFAVDHERRLRYFNDAAEEAYDRSHEEAIGTPGHDFFDTEGSRKFSPKPSPVPVRRSGRRSSGRSPRRTDISGIGRWACRWRPSRAR